MNPPITILLIEDSPTDRRVFKRYLEDQQKVRVRVVEAPTGKDALTLCVSERPACLVVDHKLPDTTASQLIPKLREITDVPIVFFTAQPEALAQSQAYRNGVVICLSKDFLSSESFQSAVFGALGLT
jgi:CheY-like chemotaxis protein